MKKTVFTSPLNLLFVFQYRGVVKRELSQMDGIKFASIKFAKRKPRLAGVLSVDEVGRILGQMKDKDGLITQLMYESGLRVSEAVARRCNAKALST